MKTITVCKADPIVRAEPVEDVRLNIVEGVRLLTESLPDLEAVERFYMLQADMIMTAIKALPGGTRHQLLIMMLQEHQHLFIG